MFICSETMLSSRDRSTCTRMASRWSHDLSVLRSLSLPSIVKKKTRFLSLFTAPSSLYTNEGRKEGSERGREEGRKGGREGGREEGRKEGSEEEREEENGEEEREEGKEGGRK